MIKITWLECQAFPGKAYKDLVTNILSDERVCLTMKVIFRLFKPFQLRLGIPEGSLRNKKTAPEGGFGSDLLQDFLHQSFTRIVQQRL